MGNGRESCITYNNPQLSASGWKYCCTEYNNPSAKRPCWVEMLYKVQQFVCRWHQLGGNVVQSATNCQKNVPVGPKSCIKYNNPQLSASGWQDCCTAYNNPKEKLVKLRKSCTEYNNSSADRTTLAGEVPYYAGICDLHKWPAGTGKSSPDQHSTI